MVTGPDSLREMTTDEEEAVDALLILAFGGADEARLVRDLRKGLAIAAEQVMTADGGIVAYCALSRMIAPKGWLCLAPVAVHPDYQGRRVGTRMVGLVAEWARISGTYLVVLGDVPFYERAGFSHARARNLTSPYPAEHMLLAGPGLDSPGAELVYPVAFGSP